ncbi:MAG TPA: hypothetical protein VK716_04710 [Terracidiphilus sp.]|nr:hypothetical protein [Terracidiphilus sp.]
MASPMMEHIPLTSAYLCQDCECIGNCATSCPACASRALLALAGVLNREAALHVSAMAYTLPESIAQARAA